MRTHALVLRSGLAISLMILTPEWGSAASRHADPDWPCPQRLVPTLSAGQFWSGPSVDGAGDWREEPDVATLVRTIMPRRTTAEQGEALIRDFANALTSDRARMLTLVFAGALEETNRHRSDLIDRIKALSRRQRELADIAARAADDLRMIPSDATEQAAERRQDLELRHLYVARAFDEGQRTLRYACEVPVQLEARLGVYARVLQEGLS
jgi:hypothetical protein